MAQEDKHPNQNWTYLCDSRDQVDSAAPLPPLFMGDAEVSEKPSLFSMKPLDLAPSFCVFIDLETLLPQSHKTAETVITSFLYIEKKDKEVKRIGVALYRRNHEITAITIAEYNASLKRTVTHYLFPQAEAVPQIADNVSIRDRTEIDKSLSTSLPMFPTPIIDIVGDYYGGVPNTVTHQRDDAPALQRWLQRILNLESSKGEDRQNIWYRLLCNWLNNPALLYLSTEKIRAVLPQTVSAAELLVLQQAQQYYCPTPEGLQNHNDYLGLLGKVRSLLRPGNIPKPLPTPLIKKIAAAEPTPETYVLIKTAADESLSHVKNPMLKGKIEGVQRQCEFLVSEEKSDGEQESNLDPSLIHLLPPSPLAQRRARAKQLLLTLYPEVFNKKEVDAKEKQVFEDYKARIEHPENEKNLDFIEQEILERVISKDEYTALVQAKWPNQTSDNKEDENNHDRLVTRLVQTKYEKGHTQADVRSLVDVIALDLALYNRDMAGIYQGLYGEQIARVPLYNKPIVGWTAKFLLKLFVVLLCMATLFSVLISEGILGALNLPAPLLPLVELLSQPLLSAVIFILGVVSVVEYARGWFSPTLSAAHAKVSTAVWALEQDIFAGSRLKPFASLTATQKAVVKEKLLYLATIYLAFYEKGVTQPKPAVVHYCELLRTCLQKEETSSAVFTALYKLLLYYLSEIRPKNYENFVEQHVAMLADRQEHEEVAHYAPEFTPLGYRDKKRSVLAACVRSLTCGLMDIHQQRRVTMLGIPLKNAQRSTILRGETLRQLCKCLFNVGLMFAASYVLYSELLSSIIANGFFASFGGAFLLVWLSATVCNTLLTAVFGVGHNTALGIQRYQGKDYDLYTKSWVERFSLGLFTLISGDQIIDNSVRMLLLRLILPVAIVLCLIVSFIGIFWHYEEVQILSALFSLMLTSTSYGLCRSSAARFVVSKLFTFLGLSAIVIALALFGVPFLHGYGTLLPWVMLIAASGCMLVAACIRTYYEMGNYRNEGIFVLSNPTQFFLGYGGLVSLTVAALMWTPTSTVVPAIFMALGGIAVAGRICMIVWHEPDETQLEQLKQLGKIAAICVGVLGVVAWPRLTHLSFPFTPSQMCMMALTLWIGCPLLEKVYTVLYKPAPEEDLPVAGGSIAPMPTVSLPDALYAQLRTVSASYSPDDSKQSTETMDEVGNNPMSDALPPLFPLLHPVAVGSRQ